MLLKKSMRHHSISSRPVAHDSFSRRQPPPPIIIIVRRCTDASRRNVSTKNPEPTSSGDRPPCAHAIGEQSALPISPPNSKYHADIERPSITSAGRCKLQRQHGLSIQTLVPHEIAGRMVPDRPAAFLCACSSDFSSRLCDIVAISAGKVTAERSQSWRHLFQFQRRVHQPMHQRRRGTLCA